MTKQSPSRTEAMRDRPAIEITPAMIAEGVRAYLGHAAHDEMSFYSEADTVEAILTAALAGRPSH